MPFTYRIDVDLGVLFVKGTGETSQVDRLKTMQAWIDDPAFRPGLNTFCDFSEVTSAPSLGELREIVRVMKSQADRIGRKKLAVITSQPVTFGVARQFQSLLDSDPIEVSVFTDRDAAWAWLQVSKAEG